MELRRAEAERFLALSFRRRYNLLTLFDLTTFFTYSDTTLLEPTAVLILLLAAQKDKFSGKILGGKRVSKCTGSIQTPCIERGLLKSQIVVDFYRVNGLELFPTLWVAYLDQLEGRSW